MSFTRLDPPIPVHVLERGDGLAFACIDYGCEHNLIWVTAIDATGEIWCAPNPKVRMQPNWTMQRSAKHGKSQPHGIASSHVPVTQSVAQENGAFHVNGRFTDDVEPHDVS